MITLFHKKNSNSFSRDSTKIVTTKFLTQSLCRNYHQNHTRTFSIFEIILKFILIVIFSLQIKILIFVIYKMHNLNILFDLTHFQNVENFKKLVKRSVYKLMFLPYHWHCSSIEGI